MKHVGSMVSMSEVCMKYLWSSYEVVKNVWKYVCSMYDV